MFLRFASVFVLMLALAAPAVFSEGDPLVINASVLTTPRNLHEAFLVEAKIQNVSQDIQIITVWQCDEKSNWITSLDEMRLADNKCSGERLTRVLLNPGKSYRRRLKFSLGDSPQNPVPVSFKVGFLSIKDPDYLGTISYAESPVWSDPITIDYSANR